MVVAISMRLADAAREHFDLVVAVMAIAVLVVLWPKIVQRIEHWSSQPPHKQLLLD